MIFIQFLYYLYTHVFGPTYISTNHVKQNTPDLINIWMSKKPGRILIYQILSK